MKTTFFDFARFKNPPAELKGAPFFSLNHDLRDHARIRDYIDAFAEMGIGGYHLHVRCGLKNNYLGKDFMEAITAARNYGAEKGMLSYLYDEDTWPSGFAGGAVTTELTFRKRWVELQKGKPETVENEYRSPLCAYRVELDSTGRLLQSERIPFEDGKSKDWFLTRCIQQNDDRFNGAAYLDTLSPAAVQAFIKSTHEVYLENFGGEFPLDVPAIFTDEPKMATNTPLGSSFEGIARFDWTDDLQQSFNRQYDVELLDVLPEVIWPPPEGPRQWRWRFWDHLTERFVAAFSDGLGQWCDDHGISLTGHMMNEDNLPGQVSALGECMRHYRSFQMPGIDILCDSYLPATAKQAVSVARQDGRAGVLSELYGVTNWDFPFSGHKRQGDWQAALGITLRVHHLSWLSMEGQSKRDYPACMGPQSPWYREYPVVENHFSRVGAALTSGKAMVCIGVIHPVESAWLNHGVTRIDGPLMAKLNGAYEKLVETLLSATLDFDFIAESLLPQQERATDFSVLRVGEMAYQVVVIPEVETLRESTLQSLEKFIQRGGTVLVIGDVPACCEAVPSERPHEALKGAIILSADSLELVKALEPWREIAVNDARSTAHPKTNHQLRSLGEDRILFCSNRTDHLLNKAPWADETWHTRGEIMIRGLWRVRELDTSEGIEKECSYSQEDGWTRVPWDLQPQSHRLLYLSPGVGECRLPDIEWISLGDCPEPESVSLEESNALLLDRAAIQVNEEAWLEPEDTLFAQQKLAKRFGWPDWAQPYSVKDPGPLQRVIRRFEFECDADFQNLKLVCERVEEASIRLDGHEIESCSDGWWVDRDLTTLLLPEISKGKHHLEIELELDAINRHLEWCYLLGEFHVQT